MKLLVAELFVHVGVSACVLHRYVLRLARRVAAHYVLSEVRLLLWMWLEAYAVFYVIRVVDVIEVLLITADHIPGVSLLEGSGGTT